MPIEFCAIDVETTMLAPEELGSKSHPMCPDNRIVLAGFKYPVWPEGIGLEALTDSVPIMESHACFLSSSSLYTLCGCNISFDLMYLYKTSPVLYNNLKRVKIWDIQLAEYLLSGQKIKFASLDQLCLKYGLPVKDTHIYDTFFSKGIGADLIPREILETYLQQDLDNTYKIAEYQRKYISKAGLTTLLLTQMDALRATTEMSYNGLFVDTEALDKHTVEVSADFYLREESLMSKMRGTIVEDINSSQQWSKYFFGGEKKSSVKEMVGTFKNGKPKYGNKEVIETISPAIPATVYSPPSDKIGKSGFVSVDEEVLSSLSGWPESKLSSEVSGIVDDLLKYREHSKQLSTYVKGMGKNIISSKPPGGVNYIHGKINHTATVTGRLSSSNPNLQNISNNEIKKIFTSRYTDGWLVEVDFNQLEVVVLAYLSGDPELKTQLNLGVDIHSHLFERRYKRLPTKEERKLFKAQSFQLIYGAGVKAIAKAGKTSTDEAKGFIDTFYATYPGVRKWHGHMQEMADRFSTRELVEGTTSIFHPYREYGHKTISTGRKLCFREYRNDYKFSTRDYDFSLPELKNYPVQSLATGDIVPMMLGVIYNWLVDKPFIKMVNTVHDSILFDMPEAYLDEFVYSIKEILDNTDKIFEEIFGYSFDVKLRAGVSVGKNWFSMEEIKL
jgi:DNA polymerase I-like protein with 3'-5' exonuclease and polymerase domains